MKQIDLSDEDCEFIALTFGKPRGVQLIAEELGISETTVRTILVEYGYYNKRKTKQKYPDRWKDPEPVAECIKHSICPKCGKKLAIERIPFTTVYDCFCITCSRFPLPESYQGG